MTNISKEDLPELDPNQSRLFELTTAAGRHFPVRFGNDLWTIVCTAEPKPWKPEIALPLLIGGEPSALELTFTPGAKLFERHSEFRDIASMSEPFALAIRATLNRELLDSLQNAFDAEVEIAPSFPKPLPPLLLAFDILDQNGTAEGRGVLRIGLETLKRIEGIAPSWQARKNSKLESLPQPVALCVAAINVPVDDLANLRAGDCLLLGDSAAWPYQIWISAGAAPMPTGIPANAAQPPLLETSTQSAMNSSDSTSAPLPISGLQFPILIVAGRREMTLHDLSSLREGASIEIGNGEEIAVELEVNHQVVAKGRLVRVADKICANITEVISLPQA
jgi:flagellar motor switch/type III secretory pathway protein FliN